MRTRSQARNPESGYVLLFVFALSAIVAIGLYQQLPRAAFEAQREKEQLLINHGEQYKRGVQLYVRKMGRYPANLSDLDNTQNIRFLRKHYFDPMTGKEEWRLLHMGPAGKLIDSKIEVKDPNKDEWRQGSITEFKSAGSSSDGGTENVNIATRKRPSDDQVQVGMPGGTMTTSAPDPSQMASNPPQGAGPGGANVPPDPNAPPRPSPAGWVNGGALPGMPPGQRGLTVPLSAQAIGAANSSANSSQSSVQGNGGYGSSVSGNGGFGAGSSTPSQPGSQPGNPFFTPNQPGSPYPTASGSNQPGAPGFGQPGQQTSATNMINNLLTQPRPGGMPGGTGMPGIGGTVVGGLAGVASTYKGRGIIHYNDQDEYIKWEFYYDLGAEQAAAVQQQQKMMQGPGQTTSFQQSGTPAPSSPPTPPQQPFGPPASQ